MHSQEFSDHESLQRLAEQRGDLLDSASSDFAVLSRILSSANVEQMHAALLDAANEGDVGSDHVMGAIGSEGLNLIGTALLRNLEDAGAGGGSESRITAMVPGMLGADIEQLTPMHVTSLIKFARERYPEALVRTAEEVARSQPSLLQYVIGQEAVKAVGSRLAKMMLEQKPA